jgi:Zn finger protein HypA/HybF involved in hydrogenase expression
MTEMEENKETFIYKLTCPKCGYIGFNIFDHKLSEEELKSMDTKCEKCGYDSKVKLLDKKPIKKGVEGTIKDYGYRYQCPNCGVVRILNLDTLTDPSEFKIKCDQCNTWLEMKDVVKTIEVHRW